MQQRGEREACPVCGRSWTVGVERSHGFELRIERRPDRPVGEDVIDRVGHGHPSCGHGWYQPDPPAGPLAPAQRRPSHRRHPSSRGAEIMEHWWVRTPRVRQCGRGPGMGSRSKTQRPERATFGAAEASTGRAAWPLGCARRRGGPDHRQTATAPPAPPPSPTNSTTAGSGTCPNWTADEDHTGGGKGSCRPSPHRSPRPRSPRRGGDRRPQTVLGRRTG